MEGKHLVMAIVEMVTIVVHISLKFDQRLKVLGILSRVGHKKSRDFQFHLGLKYVQTL